MSGKKNIVFILADQLRADYLGCYGSKCAQTSNIDSLAQEGVVYENTVSPSPLCVPARASLLTGRNTIENGVLENANWLRPDHEACGVYTWPKLLTDSGYETVGIGKMHFYPWDVNEGFETRIICEDKRHCYVEDDYFDFLKGYDLKKLQGIECVNYHEHKGAIVNPLPRDKQADVWIAEQACQYLEKREDERPLAMMVGFLSPHEPYDPDSSLLTDFNFEDMPEPIPSTEESRMFMEKFVNAYKEDWSQLDFSNFTTEEKKRIKAHYMACIKDIDLGVGRIVETLKAKGMYEDTVLIFTADHGDFAGDFDMIGKHYFYEPSVRVPLVIAGPGVCGRGEMDSEVVSLTDVRATILHIAGITECETEESKILSCYTQKNEDRMVCGTTDIGWLIRWKNWKFTMYHNGLSELYDLEQDPCEQHNLIGEEKTLDIQMTLQRKLCAWVMRAINNANREKLAGPGAARTPQEHFKRNWQRTYPYKKNN